MVLNLALLFLVFTAEKKKLKPYVAAGLFGLVKAIIYVVFSGQWLLAVAIGATLGGLVSAFVYLLRRLDRREAGEQPGVPTYRAGGSDKMTFRWEYIPIVVLLLLIVGGEFFLLPVLLGAR
jgi:hypothetical protein